METDDLALALHAVRGETNKVTLKDGILIWVPTTSSSSETIVDYSSNTTTTDTTTNTNTTTNLDNPNILAHDPILSALVLAGCRRIQELTHNHINNKTEALTRGTLNILLSSIFQSSTNNTNNNTTEIIDNPTGITTPSNEPSATIPSSHPTHKHHHHHHHHRKHHMGVHTVALRAIKSIVFKHEAGKRAAGPVGIVLETLTTLRYALSVLMRIMDNLSSSTISATSNDSNTTNLPSISAVDEFILALGLVEEGLTTLVALCTGAGGDDNLILVKEGGGLTNDELNKAQILLQLIHTNWKQTPLGIYQLQHANTNQHNKHIPLALASGILPTINATESLKRIVFLQALL